MYVIMTGNPTVGFSLYLNPQGFPFDNPEDAVSAAEDARFEDAWWIVTAAAITDVGN